MDITVRSDANSGFKYIDLKSPLICKFKAKKLYL